MDISYAWLLAIAPGLGRSLEEEVKEGERTAGETTGAEVLAHRLALRGAPVESIAALAEGLDGVVVARVEAAEPHPNADRLALCTVDAGGGDRRRVVCGAPNVRVGGLYPFAPAGTTLPGDFAIREAKIRGEVSQGMLCSARELRLGTDASGLLELPEGLEPGASLVAALALRDWRLDVEVTPNRGDLLSHLGVAREVAPGGDASLLLPDIPGATEPDLELTSDPREATSTGATVRVDDPDLCFRYLGAVVRGVRVGPSPTWLQARLRAAGARPVNNVVDATNYVLLELGQPLHAFDLAKLEGSTVVVRRPRAEEGSFRTLDGLERKLAPDMLMICDAEVPIAVAGVMGGLDSEVTADTTDVLLECALFEPRSIRATRRALGMSTDASYRFERGVDPEGMERALRRAVALIVATAGGRAEPTVMDVRPRPFQRTVLRLRPERVERVLGVRLGPDALGDLLRPLGFEVEGAEDGLRVGVPGFRSYDVTREIDLIEEVARAHGFDAFPDDLGPFRPGSVPDHPLFALEDRARDLLVSRGLFEAHTPAFVGEAQGKVRLRNPISVEEAYLRSRVVPSLLRRVEHNWSRGVRDVRLFELATAFTAAPEQGRPREEPRLAAVLTGRRAPVHFADPGEAFDVWDLEGVLEDVAGVAWSGATLRPGAPEGSGLVDDEAFTVYADGEGVVGWGGRATSASLDAPPWADAVFALELRLPPEPLRRPAPTHLPLPPFPAVERDLALLVPESRPAADVEAAIRARGGALLREVGLFDLYRGKGVPAGHRSLAYRLRFFSPDRTLTDDEVDRAVGGVVEHLREAFGVERRG